MMCLFMGRFCLHITVLTYAALLPTYGINLVSLGNILCSLPEVRTRKRKGERLKNDITEKNRQ